MWALLPDARQHLRERLSLAAGRGARACPLDAVDSVCSRPVEARVLVSCTLSSALSTLCWKACLCLGYLGIAVQYRIKI